MWRQGSSLQQHHSSPTVIYSKEFHSEIKNLHMFIWWISGHFKYILNLWQFLDIFDDLYNWKFIHNFQKEKKKDSHIFLTSEAIWIKLRFSYEATGIWKKKSHLLRHYWHWVNFKTGGIFFQILWPSHNVITLKNEIGLHNPYNFRIE